MLRPLFLAMDYKPRIGTFFILVGTGLHRRFVFKKNPELLQRRRRIGEGTKRWDVVWNLLFWPQMIAALPPSPAAAAGASTSAP